jgi:hypothetical protein
MICAGMSPATVDTGEGKRFGGPHIGANEPGKPGWRPGPDWRLDKVGE